MRAAVRVCEQLVDLGIDFEADHGCEWIVIVPQALVRNANSFFALQGSFEPMSRLGAEQARALCTGSASGLVVAADELN